MRARVRARRRPSALPAPARQAALEILEKSLGPLRCSGGIDASARESTSHYLCRCLPDQAVAQILGKAIAEIKVCKRIIRRHLGGRNEHVRRVRRGRLGVRHTPKAGGSLARWAQHRDAAPADRRRRAFRCGPANCAAITRPGLHDSAKAAAARVFGEHPAAHAAKPSAGGAQPKAKSRFFVRLARAKASSMGPQHKLSWIRWTAPPSTAMTANVCSRPAARRGKPPFPFEPFITSRWRL